MAIDIVSFIGFAVPMVATPGPANTVLMASGAAHGTRASLPFLAGVILGKQGVLWASGFGVAAALAARPDLYGILKWVGSAYVVWLAWKIARSEIASNASDNRPLRFSDGLPVHPLNPKAWAMVLVAMVTFGGDTPSVTDIATIAVGFLIVQAIFQTIWLVAGAAVARQVAGSALEPWLMRGLALLLLTSVGAVLFWEE